MQRDPSRHDGAQAEQGGQVEDVRPDHYASPHRLLVVQERGHRGGDLGSVGRQRRRHPEQGFRKPEPFAHSLQAGHEDPARRQANDGADDEGDERKPHRHRHLSRPWGDVPGTERQPNLVMYRMGTAAAHVGSFVRTSTTPTRLPGSPKPTVHLGPRRPT